VPQPRTAERYLTLSIGVALAHRVATPG